MNVTQRQWRILECVCRDDMSVRETAVCLGVTPYTVQRESSYARTRLGVKMLAKACFEFGAGRVTAAPERDS